MLARLYEAAFHDLNLRPRRRPTIDNCIEDLRRGFAQFATGDQGSGRGAVISVANDLADLFRGKDFRLGGEAEQVVVAGQQFFRAAIAEAPVERIDKVKRQMPADKLK